MLSFQKSNPPEKYVQSFCSAILSNIKTMFDALNSTTEDAIYKMETFEKNSNKNRDKFENNIIDQVNDLFSQYHEIDKEMFKVQDIHIAVKDQTGLNIEIIEQLKSLDGKFKILFKIIILLLGGNVTFVVYFIIKILGGQ